MQWHHPIEQIWSMTPRQAFAWLAVGAARHSNERAQLLSDFALAAQGGEQNIKNAIRELSED